MTKSEILEAQKMLNAIGFNSGTPDGIIGTNTKNAVLAFQKTQASLTNDGILGPNTFNVLKQVYKAKIVPTTSKTVSPLMTSAPSTNVFQTSSKFDISKLINNKSILVMATGIVLIAILYPVIIKKKRI